LDRAKFGKIISGYLQLKPTDHVLEIGSGSGDMAASLAPDLERLYCADISRSFIEVARKKCEKWPHASFHHLQSFELDFIKSGTLDAVYAHAVFIHLNLYEFYWYFKSFSKVLKEDGKIYIDFLSSRNLSMVNNSFFIEHADYYVSNKNSLPRLRSFNNPQDIIKLARHFHLHLELYWTRSEGSVGLILRKLTNPSWITLLKNSLWTGYYILKQRINRRFFLQ
jgi:cyclopropane fatty-acyl-phospholipid synthase-like methyltransferase